MFVCFFAVVSVQHATLQIPLELTTNVIYRCHGNETPLIHRERRESANRQRPLTFVNRMETPGNTTGNNPTIKITVIRGNHLVSYFIVCLERKIMNLADANYMLTWCVVNNRLRVPIKKETLFFLFYLFIIYLFYKFVVLFLSSMIYWKRTNLTNVATFIVHTLQKSKEIAKGTSI